MQKPDPQRPQPAQKHRPAAPQNKDAAPARRTKAAG